MRCVTALFTCPRTSSSALAAREALVKCEWCVMCHNFPSFRSQNFFASSIYLNVRRSVVSRPLFSRVRGFITIVLSIFLHTYLLTMVRCLTTILCNDWSVVCFSDCLGSLAGFFLWYVWWASGTGVWSWGKCALALRGAASGHKSSSFRDSYFKE